MASQDSHARLGALPNELLEEILYRMNSPEDLLAAICASKRLSQVFSSLRERMIIRVIQNSLDPGIFMEIVGLLHVPNYTNLHYVAPESSAIVNEPAYLRARREMEQARLSRLFREEHFTRIDEALSIGNTGLFPVPSLRRTDNHEQRARFRQEVNEVAGIYACLRSHTIRKLTAIDYFPDCNGSVPPNFYGSSTFTMLPPSPYRTLALKEQRRYLREYVLRSKMTIFPTPSQLTWVSYRLS